MDDLQFLAAVSEMEDDMNFLQAVQEAEDDASLVEAAEAAEAQLREEEDKAYATQLLWDIAQDPNDIPKLFGYPQAPPKQKLKQQKLPYRRVIALDTDDDSNVKFEKLSKANNVFENYSVRTTTEAIFKRYAWAWRPDLSLIK